MYAYRDHGYIHKQANGLLRGLHRVLPRRGDFRAAAAQFFFSQPSLPFGACTGLPAPCWNWVFSAASCALCGWLLIQLGCIRRRLFRSLTLGVAFPVALDWLTR